MLSLTEKFERDIQQNHSTVYPLIIIDNQYYISTIEETILSNNEPVKFKDYGLKVSNIKESIDVKSHSFKISNVSITLNNYVSDGIRLSDAISDKTNKEIVVYYKTQSCQTLEDCLLAYKGVLKRNTYDESILTLTLEDPSDILFKKDVPVANLGFSKNTYNQDYINRPIPMTYGEVQKAPVIPWIDEDSNSGKMNLYIIPDDVEEVTGSGREITINDFNNGNTAIPELMFEEGDNKESYLYIYKDDYYRVLQDYNIGISGQQLASIYTKYNQYNIDDSGQFISVSKSFTGATPENPPAHNEFQTAKILRPNQAEILISEGGVAEEGNVGSIIDLEPYSGILRPQASVDSQENSTIFFDEGAQSEFSTFTQIPNNQTNEDNALIEDGELIVNRFINSSSTSETEGIYYPTDEYFAENTNYIWLISAWLQTNAHHTKIKFISAPSGNMVTTYADYKSMDKGWRESGLGQIFKCYASGNNFKAAEILPQYALSQYFKNSWINACDGITGEEVSGDHEYFPSVIDDNFARNTLAPIDNGEIYNNSEIFAHPDRNAIYPQTVYKIECDINHTNNIEGISTVYIGQWDEATMNGALQSDERWINLFYNEDDPERDYLFDKNDFATFEPFDLKLKTNPSDNKIKTQYAAKYNNVGIGYYNGSQINEPSDRINDDFAFAGGYGFLSNVSSWWQSSNTHRVSMAGLCGHNAAASGGNYGGMSWWMMVEENIDSDRLMQNLSGQEAYFGEFVDGNCNTTVKKGTLIPCNNRYDYNISGHNWEFNFTENFSKNTITLTTGDDATGYNATPEQRLSILYPLPDISATDVMEGETSTFVYGSLSLNVPPTSEANHTCTAQDSILVQAYATSTLSDDELENQGGLNYNAEFVGTSKWGTNLLNISGDSDLFTNGGQAIWDVRDIIDESENSEQMYESLDLYQIEDWDTPDYVNALALTYRIRNDNAVAGNRASISTDISSIGLLQYSTFSNVFKSNLYADIFGRSDDENGKYTNAGLQMIQNPADVLYHFIEKELEAIDITDIDSWEDTRINNSNIKLAFSVKEKVNSKTLVQNIAKNTNIFPKFNSQNKFSYSYISKTYNQSDVEIKQSDVIDFQFTRTPSEDIYTLVNVKYKKDYEKDSYLKETGYCDGYDFFGNSENGAEVYKKDDQGNYQWDSNGYNYNLLGLKREDNILEFESDFIRDYESAVELRNYLYLLNCNQHTIVKCTLPLKYIKLEVGDIIEFDELHNNLKAFGEDYTKRENFRNGQKIYPYFIITSINKTSKNIKVDCMQLHELQGNFSTGNGSLSRRSELGINYWDLKYDEAGNIVDAFENVSNSHITLEDVNILENIIVGLDSNYITSSQKKSADLSNDGTIGQWDLNILEIIFNSTNLIIGDVNDDGEINIVDLVATIEYIIGSMNLNQSQLLASDINESGEVNVSDIVGFINLILQQD